MGGLALSSCGSVSKITSTNAVSDAFSNLGKQSSLSLQFSLGVTPAQAQQLDKSITSQQAQAILTGSVFLDVQTGHGEALDSTQAQTDSDSTFDAGLQIGSSTPVELRYVAQNIYAKADISSVVSTLGLPDSDAAKVQSALQSADAYVPGLSALGQGQWVEISHASLQPFLDLLKGSGSQTSSSINKLGSDLAAAFKSNTTFKDAGTSGGRTHYQMITAIQPFVQQAVTALSSDLTSLPGGSAIAGKLFSALSKDVTKIPANLTTTVDLYVQNNQAQEIDFDLNQFENKYAFPVPLKLVIGSWTGTTAPSGATPLDLSKLPQLLGGLVGKLGLGSTSAAG